jgi:hypothetical protein
MIKISNPYKKHLRCFCIRSCLMLCVVALCGFIPVASVHAEGSVDLVAPTAEISQIKVMNSFFRIPKDEKLIYTGLVNFDTASGGGSAMLYPAPNVGGFLAAVITHGLLVNSINDSKKQKIREAADKVLIPYLDILNEYTHSELVGSSLDKITTLANKSAINSINETQDGDLLVDSLPVFSMTQDQRAIILENAISIRVSKSEPPYKNLIRVFSPVKSAEDLVKFWSGEHGLKLKEESARLFAISVDIAISDLTNKDKNKEGVYKTIRYMEGGIEKMERAQLISAKCNQILIKTLRGNLMSVPLKNTDSNVDAVSCNETADALGALAI